MSLFSTIRTDMSANAPRQLRKEQLLEEIDEQWPSMKLLGFGAYYAWIWLCYNSTILFPSPTAAAVTVFDIYLASTLALGVSLMACAACSRFAARFIDSKPFNIFAGVLVCAGTLVTTLSTCQPDWAWLVYPMGVLTGVGTSVVALRIGVVYSAIPARKAAMYAAASFILACMLYFVGVGMPYWWGVVFTSVLPLGAVVLSAASHAQASDMPGQQPDSADDDGEGLEDGADGADGAGTLGIIRPLTLSFMLRFVAGIGLYSLVIGVTRAFGAGNIHYVNADGAIIVSLTALCAVFIYLFMGLQNRTFNIARLYSVSMVLTAVGILLVPTVTVFFSGSLDRYFESSIIGAGYALFVLFVWCLCAHVSYTTKASPIKVFGFGRGSSALGTAFGWMVGFAINDRWGAEPLIMMGITIIMGFIMLVVATLVFNEYTVMDMEDDSAFGPRSLVGDVAPAGQPVAEGNAAMSDDEQAYQPSDQDEGPRRLTWKERCAILAKEHGLTSREEEVLMLLGKGRTLDYIHNELSISMNTTKTHVRNVYRKLGVHTRSELLDLLEEQKP